MIQVFVLLIANLVSYCFFAAPTYDLILINGVIVDGLATPAYRADIGINADTIAIISKKRLRASQGKQVIDVKGKIIAPGFIDSHAHIQTTIHEFPQPENFLRQGITTICASLHAGDQPWPLDQYARALKVAPNVAFFAGLNWTRKKVMGLENRPATWDDVDSMQYYVDQTMRQGAVGFSAGLIYVPGLYASTAEIVELAKVTSQHGGLFATHMRNESSGLLASIHESIRIAKLAHIPVQINHFKAAGVAQFGLAKKGLALVDSARQAGIDITIDVYPYTAANTYSYILFPAWALDGGTKELIKRLKDPELRKKIKVAMRDIIMQDETGEDLRRIQFNSLPVDTSFNGKTLQDYILAKGYDNTLDGGLEAVMDLEVQGGFLAIYHEMDEQDVIDILKYPYAMIETDGDLVKPNGNDFPHPRSFGSFPRVLARYVRELKILTLEQAIQKMTSMPANQIKQPKRGRIQQGCFADLVVFDKNRIQDKATYIQSRQYAEGIDYLLINGTLVINNRVLTGKTPGKWLRNKAFN
jgi:N-acyl-D-aspartate/D-glutamate deacylase